MSAFAVSAGRVLDVLRRIAVVTVLVITLGGVSCYDHTGLEIRYAPGYGYVVRVEEHEIDSVPGSGTYAETVRSYYYVFATEEDARKFIREFERLKRPPGGIYSVVKQGSQDFARIHGNLQPLPSTPTAGRMAAPIDGVVPPVPTAPAPQ